MTLTTLAAPHNPTFALRPSARDARHDVFAFPARWVTQPLRNLQPRCATVTCALPNATLKARRQCKTCDVVDRALIQPEHSANGSLGIRRFSRPFVVRNVVPALPMNDTGPRIAALEVVMLRVWPTPVSV